MAKGLKDIRPPRPSPAEMVNLARTQEPTLPPAVMQQPSPPPAQPPVEEMVQLNVRVRRGLADQLADRAATERVSQRVLIARALQAAGYDVHPDDLTDRVVRRRRGTSAIS